MDATSPVRYFLVGLRNQGATTCSSAVSSMLLLACCFSASFAFAADTITGTVRNQTTARPAAGDDVVLLRLTEGMQEEARTKTDVQGAFFLKVSVTKARHVVRVLHQGVNYDQTVTGDVPLEIKVFDAVPRISGLNGNIGIVRMESDGNVLKVAEMYAITNASTPPVTQSGPHNFEIFLPEKAAFDSVEAKGPEGIWTNVPPVALPGQPGRYTVNFPLRPGDTLFKFAYHLPHQAATTFHLKLAYPIKSFAVMHPPSMSFKALHPSAFMSPGVANGLQVEQAVTKTFVSHVPAFEISGIGMVQPRTSATQTTPPLAAAGPANTAGGGAVDHGINATPAPPGQSANEGWFVLAAIFAILAAGMFAYWRRRQKLVPTAQVESVKDAGNPQPLLVALKEELFQLETDRMRGSISMEEYTATKQALGHTLQRAMKKGKP